MAELEDIRLSDPYVLEQLARKMLAERPALAREFQDKLASDPKLAADPQARLDFFYRRSPFWDREVGLYPVARITGDPPPK